MRRPEWPGADSAQQERDRRAAILRQIGSINPAAENPDRLTARRVYSFFTGGGGGIPTLLIMRASFKK